MGRFKAYRDFNISVGICINPDHFIIVCQSLVMLTLQAVLLL